MMGTKKRIRKKIDMAAKQAQQLKGRASAEVRKAAKILGQKVKKLGERIEEHGH